MYDITVTFVDGRIEKYMHVADFNSEKDCLAIVKSDKCVLFIMKDVIESVYVEEVGK